MTGLHRHVPVDPADHPPALGAADALGGMFEPDAASTAEARLFAAVLLQAVADATAPSTPRNSFDRREARAWLDAGGRHFALVCDLAGLNPARVTGHWKRLRATPIPPSAFRAGYRKHS